jgi:hypothetical protein
MIGKERSPAKAKHGEPGALESERVLLGGRDDTETVPRNEAALEVAGALKDLERLERDVVLGQ